MVVTVNEWGEIGFDGISETGRYWFQAVTEFGWIVLQVAKEFVAIANVQVGVKTESTPVALVADNIRGVGEGIAAYGYVATAMGRAFDGDEYTGNVVATSDSQVRDRVRSAPTVLVIDSVFGSEDRFDGCSIYVLSPSRVQYDSGYWGDILASDEVIGNDGRIVDVLSDVDAKSVVCDIAGVSRAWVVASEIVGSTALFGRVNWTSQRAGKVYDVSEFGMITQYMDCVYGSDGLVVELYAGVQEVLEALDTSSVGLSVLWEDYGYVEDDVAWILDVVGVALARSKIHYAFGRLILAKRIFARLVTEYVTARLWRRHIKSHNTGPSYVSVKLK